MAFIGLGWGVGRGNVDDDVAGEGVAANMADESGTRRARGVGAGGGEMELKLVAEDRAIDTASLVAGAVSADEND